MMHVHHILEFVEPDGAIWLVDPFDESNGRTLLLISVVLVRVQTVLAGHHRVGEIDRMLGVLTTPRTGTALLRHGVSAGKL